MKKQQLKNKLIRFQKDILSLTQELNNNKRLLEEKEQQNNLELISLIDSFENIFNSLDASNSNELDKRSKRVIKSCRSIYRKTNRILESKGVNRIEFTDNQAQPGLCKIIETTTDLTKQNGSIVEIIKNGYHKDKQIIRSAEVITTLNA